MKGNDSEPEVNSSPEPVPDLSLLGGPLHQLARWMGPGRPLVGCLRLSIALAVVTWLPLMLLALMRAGAESGASIALPTVGAHVRLLLAIPILLISELLIDRDAAVFVRRMVQYGVVPAAERPRLAAAIHRVADLRTSALAEAVLLAGALALMPIDFAGEVKSWTTTIVGPDAHLLPAGWWYHAVSLTVFRFVLLRWCWRTAIWWSFLSRFASLDLQLIPTHPDRAGGIGYLEMVQGRVALDLFAISSVLAASFAEQVQFGGLSLESFKGPVGAALLGFAALLFGPMLFFAPRLMETRLRGRLDYGRLATEYVRQFDTKWIRAGSPPADPLLGTSDIQSLADLGNTISIMKSMRVVPIGRPLLTNFAGATLLPMAPLLLLKFPLETLLLELVKLVAKG